MMELDQSFFNDLEKVMIEKSIFGFLTPSNYKKLSDILKQQIALVFVEQKILKINNEQIRKTISNTYSPFFDQFCKISKEFKIVLQELYNDYSSKDKQKEEKIFEKLKNSFIFWQIAEKIKEQIQNDKSISNIKQLQSVTEFINILVKQFKKQKCKTCQEVSSDESQKSENNQYKFQNQQPLLIKIQDGFSDQLYDDFSQFKIIEEQEDINNRPQIKNNQIYDSRNEQTHEPNMNKSTKKINKPKQKKQKDTLLSQQQQYRKKPKTKKKNDNNLDL